MIYLMPYNQMKENKSSLSDFKKEEISLEEIIPHSDYLFFEEGKRAINYIMSELGLTRDDEVAILTTTDSSFVSSCVTWNIFNFSKVSRVITPSTKLIYVIHEFGFPYIKIAKVAEYAKNNNIPLVEDSAHSLDSYINNQKLGSFGDYAVFSLAKTFPIKSGGLLTGKQLNKKNIFYNSKIHNYKKKEFVQYLPYIKSFTQKRLKNYNYFSVNLSKYKQIFKKSKEQTSPFVFGFISTNPQQMDLSNIEIHPCYINRGTFLPTNPFITDKQLDYIINNIKKANAT